MVSPLFLRQLKSLVYKNVLISRQNWFINLIRCLVLPVLFIVFVAEAQNFFQSVGTYGVGNRFRQIRTLDSDLIGDLKFLWIDQSTNATLANRLIADVTSQLPSKQVIKVANRTELAQHCPENFNQISGCFGAVVFQSLIFNATNRNFTYQLRLDNGLFSTNVYSGEASLETRRTIPLALLYV